MGWGLRYTKDVPLTTPWDLTPSCPYELGGGAMVRVRKAEHENSDLLMPNEWGADEAFAYLPTRRGAATYANDNTRTTATDGWQRTGHRANAKHLYDPHQPGVFVLHLKPGFTAGFVHVDYGAAWWGTEGNPA